MEKIAFYTEANSDIGIGHLIRLYNFQKILKKKKNNLAFFWRPQNSKKNIKKRLLSLKVLKYKFISQQNSQDT